MFRVQSIGIAAAICFLFLFGMVNSSDAQINIIDMSMTSEVYNYGYIYDSYAYIETDRPYDTIYWYIGDPNDGDDNLQYVGETLGDGGATRARFYPGASDCPGNIKGQKYRVAAKAWYFNRETRTSTSDWESRDFRVFEPKVISGTQDPPAKPEHQRGTGIYGRVELTRHYHDGQNIVVDASVYAYNGTKITLHASSWYRHTRFAEDGRTLWSVDHSDSGKELSPGETYDNSASSMISYWVGGDIGPTQRITLNAHIHLAVSGRVWHEENNAWTHTFTEDDNQ